MTIFECGCSICHTDNNTGDVVRLLAGMLPTLAHPPSLLFGFPCSCAAERGGERGRRAAAGRRDDGGERLQLRRRRRGRRRARGAARQYAAQRGGRRGGRRARGRGRGRQCGVRARDRRRRGLVRAHPARDHQSAGAPARPASCGRPRPAACLWYAASAPASALDGAKRCPRHYYLLLSQAVVCRSAERIRGGRALRVPNGMGHIWKSSGDCESVWALRRALCNS